jgi:ATP-dependent DNA ligase
VDVRHALVRDWTAPRRLVERKYIAESKLDGQRAQLHIQHGEAIACFSRGGLDLLRTSA